MNGARPGAVSHFSSAQCQPGSQAAFRRFLRHTMLDLRYVNNTPATGIPANRYLRCGEAFDMVCFVLFGNDIRDGAVIQMVEWTLRSKRTPGPDRADQSGYFEVWDVLGGNVIPAQYDFNAGTESFNDCFLLADPQIVGTSSKGSWSVTGWAIFVPAYDWENGPDRWLTQFDAGHDYRAGPLPTRPLNDPPSVWTPATAAGRMLTVTWTASQVKHIKIRTCTGPEGNEDPCSNVPLLYNLG
jgi:hypothetical protein